MHPTATIFAVLFLLGAAGLFWWRRKVGIELDLIRATATSRVADVDRLPVGSVVELKGKVRCAQPLSGEFSLKPCVYYSALTEREYEKTTRDSDGRSRRERQFETVQTNIRHAPCLIEDPSGRVALNFEGADVEAIETVRRYESAAGVGALVGGLLAVDATTGHRYTEKIIPPDQDLFVLGTVLADKSVGASPAKANPFVITYKSEEEKVKSLASTTMWLMFALVACAAIGLVLLGLGIWWGR